MRVAPALVLALIVVVSCTLLALLILLSSPMYLAAIAVRRAVRGRGVKRPSTAAASAQSTEACLS
jgi:hypothetical protein